MPQRQNDLAADLNVSRLASDTFWNTEDTIFQLVRKNSVPLWVNIESSFLAYKRTVQWRYRNPRDIIWILTSETQTSYGPCFRQHCNWHGIFIFASVITLHILNICSKNYKRKKSNLNRGFCKTRNFLYYYLSMSNARGLVVVSNFEFFFSFYFSSLIWHYSVTCHA